MFEYQNRLFSFKGLGIICERSLGQNKCVCSNTFWLLTLELPGRNDINLGRHVQKGFLAIRRLLFLDAKFSVTCRNSAHGCCTYSLKTYRLTVFEVERQLIFLTSDASFVSKGNAV